jgi:tRNA A-37 threonylcarbamoyl transferase component Bud32
MFNAGGDAVFVKLYSDYAPKRIYNDLTKQQAFELELEIYKRVHTNDYFPSLHEYNEERCELVIEHCGDNLVKIKKPLKIPDLRLQVDRICQVLEEQRIMHLDIWKGNICYKNGRIHLIDFDIAVVDDRPLSKLLRERYDKQKCQSQRDIMMHTLKEFVP